MTTLLFRLDQPVNGMSEIADPERLVEIMKKLRQENALIENFGNGGTYSVAIEGSTVNYTLLLEPDGTGMIQRTMSSPGSKHMTVNPQEREPVRISVPLESGGETTEIHLLADELFVLPVVVGTPVGFRLRGIFLYVPG